MITIDKLRAAGIINDDKVYPDMPVCPKVLEAVGRTQRCDDPFCIRRRQCAFNDHPRGRARWLALDLDLNNWSA
jgi:hypothetical protein